MPRKPRLTLTQINQALSRYYELDDSFVIGRRERISERIPAYEPIDLLDILHDLGVQAHEYCSGERLNEIGIDMLCYVVARERNKKDVEELGLALIDWLGRNQFPIITTQQLGKRITPGHLFRIWEYDQKRRVEKDLCWTLYA
jgi:hypothetical protein